MTILSINLDRAYVTANDGRDTEGRTLYLQIGPLVFSVGLSFGRKA